MGKQWKQCQTLFLGGFKITADDDCSHEIKRCLLLGRTSLVAQMVNICLQCERPGFDPWVGRFPGEGNGNPLQYSCLENPMDRGAWGRLLSMGSQRVGHD